MSLLLSILGKTSELMIMKKTFYLFFFTILIVFSLNSYSAECDNPASVCEPPIIGPYYIRHPTSGVTIGQFLQNLESVYESGPNVCSAEASFVGSFSGYAEEGSGQTTLNGEDVVRWHLSTNQSANDVDGVLMEITYHSTNCSDPTVRELPISRFRTVECPVDFRPNAEKTDCIKFCTDGDVNIEGECQAPPAPDPCGTPNPCIPSTGDKIKSQTDYSSNSLSFARHYNSQQTANKLSIGKSWRHSFSDKLLFNRNSAPLGYLSAKGRYLQLTEESTTNYSARSEYDRVSNVNGFEFVNQEWHTSLSNGDTRIYSETGYLVRIEHRSGQTTSLAYNSDQQLITITNDFGSSLTINYQNGLISNVIQPDGNTIKYEYDVKQNLVSVTYPDLTQNVQSDNPKLIYHYEDIRFDHHLTGITDENDVRHQTYAYDENGKVISSEKSSTTNAVGQEHFQLNYQD